MRLVIVDEENNKMQVGVDGRFYSDLDGTGLGANIHAVQWYGTTGEVEYQDPETLRPTTNETISDISSFQFAIDLWQAEYDKELSALKQAEYDSVIAGGGAEAEAQAAADAITSLD